MTSPDCSNWLMDMVDRRRSLGGAAPKWEATISSMENEEKVGGASINGLQW